MRIALVLLSLVLPCGTALSQTMDGARLGFSAYVAGFNILNGELGLALRPTGYVLAMRFRTAGTLGAVVTAAGGARVDGAWRGLDAAPREFVSRGVWRGDERRVEITYPDGQPFVRLLVPPQDLARETVPDALRRDTVDSFSMFAVLLRHVAETGRCDGVVRSFDGRRAGLITAISAGMEVLPPESRSSFEGPALRCDVQSRQIAGFPLDTAPDDAVRRPQLGTIWLAPVVAGLPPLPVLMTLDTRMVGHINVYVTRVSPGYDASVPLAEP